MKHNHSHGMGKHMLLMAICCLVPLALVGAVGVFGLSLGPLQGLVPYVAALMCPLMMVGMMWMLMKNQGDGQPSHSDHHSAPQLPVTTKEQLTLNPPVAETTPASGSGHSH